jgi:hypothetical protein
MIVASFGRGVFRLTGGGTRHPQGLSSVWVGGKKKEKEDAPGLKSDERRLVQWKRTRSTLNKNASFCAAILFSSCSPVCAAADRSKKKR